MLKEIIENKLEEVKTLKILDVKRQLPIVNMVSSLKEKPFILEIKRKSPSKGELVKEIDVKEQAKIYEKCFAGGISVLTDKKYFNGQLKDIKEVKSVVSLPVLCKDFIVDEKQIENAYLIGADTILLIVAVLSEKRLRELSQKAYGLGLTVLFEIHEFLEFEKIKNLELQMVGVNSRDLKTMEINLQRSGEVLKKIEGDFLKISESGIKTKKDIEFLTGFGANAFLIGTTLMQTKDKGKLINEFYSAICKE